MSLPRCAKGKFYVDNIPAASAKRLEKDRRLVITGNYIFGNSRKEIPILEGDDRIEFDFKDESSADEQVLDGTIYYQFHIEYRNATHTRMEKVAVEPKPIELTIHDDEW